MAEDKRLIQKDMGLILQLSSKYDMRIKGIPGKVLNLMRERKVLSSALGRVYLRRLYELENEENNVSDKICLFCRAMPSKDGVLCQYCMNQYSNNLLSFASEMHASRPSISKSAASDYFQTSDEAEDAVDVPASAAITSASDTTVLGDPAVAGDSEPASSFEALFSANAPSKEEIVESVKKGSIFARQKVDKAVDTLTEKVNVMAGGEGSVDLKLKDLFSDVPQKHHVEEAEEIFISGTKMTTPAESEIVSGWPKPWLYTRVALWFFVTFLILTFSYYVFNNTNLIPGIIFVGSFMVPISLIIFFYEVNAPRNISIFSVMKLFFVGGAASLFVTLFLFTLVEADMGFIGAIIVGLVEEIGKLAIVAGLIRQIKGRRYILNGMLIGAAVGGGFAAFESAGYALRYFIIGTLTPNANGYDIMMNVILNRAILSPGGHITWAAISGVATILALGDEEFSLSFVKKPVFYSLFAIPVIMHAIWDMPIRLFSIGPFSIVHITLILVVWIVILVLLNRGLDELKSR